MAAVTLETESDWRRRFKPDLKVATWRKLTLVSGNYLLKTFFTQNSYEVLITDLCSFWHEKMEEQELKKRIQKLNPSIEAPLTKVLDQINQNVNIPMNQDDHLSVTMKDCEDGGQNCIMSINSQLAGMPFIWKFVCEPADSELAKENLTVPLMAMVSELLRRQQELFSIIYKKDKEIEDYKSQGARISRRYLVTPPFNAIGFFHNMNVSAGFEAEMRKKGMYVFNEIGGKLYEAVMIKQAWINKSPLKRKADESLEDADSLTDDVPKEPSVASWSNRLPPSMTETKAESPKSSVNNTPESSPAKEELLRRERLERQLQEEEQKKQEKAKKKKKMAF
ncbi:non-homologous end-joining factor 1 [Patella vulgata]|uniref:non-homologous end-joining factor 1 n=1 Tax=Patella vulgata TaxID=6465 RepID=UPI00217F6E4A|nr:non-homologous end-joining factor 1 [Patella vulgata]